jgi:hypothetical protein
MEATVSKNKDEKTRTFENYTKAEDWLLSGK